MNIQTPATVDLAAIKGRQQVAWSSGDYAIVGTTLQIVGETLCEAVDLRSNQRVLDVAAGNGNATLAAARRFADVVSTDYVGALLERGRLHRRCSRHCDAAIARIAETMLCSSSSDAIRIAISLS
jgi:ubiquinone/menaquinone biosynthesis C-methylase UbiE